MTASVIALVLASFAFGGAVIMLRSSASRRLRSTHRLYRLQFARDLDPARVIRFVAGLSGLMPRWWERAVTTPALAIETRAADDGIDHYLIVPETLEPVVLS